MTVERVRQICQALPGVTEDVKWDHDLCFSIGGKMFVVVNLEPPHQIGFKCTPDSFAELIERDGIIPAPYLARAMWVQETELGAALEVRELEALIRSSYDLVVSTLPRSKRPGPASPTAGGPASATAPKTRRRTAKSATRSAAKVRGRSKPRR
jgi:predicted DNA-binding protein (MmcQ/YjbR family)